MNWKRLVGVGVALFFIFACVLSGRLAMAQSTVATGSIQGVITDPQGAAVPGAKITITNKDTGQVVRTQSNSAGAYNSGALLPGNYTVRVEAANFQTTEVPTTVQVGVVTGANVQLKLGAASTVVHVTEQAVHVNTEQATVQDVLTRQQIDQLPINGRNFLDLATLEPGVQIQDGATFDPTKNGYSSLSFGGRFGRTARIEVDGLDVSDETVGTTTENIPQSAIQEFQVSQSTLDLSTELTSSGSVNVTTRSGTNGFHGDGFYYGRSDQVSARIAPTPLPFGRKQFGGDFGGPFIKNKLFFFGDVERTDQTLANPVSLTAPFASSSGSFGSPFNEREYLGRVDWNIKPGWTFFYRFSYDQNKSIRGFNPGVYQPFGNVDRVPDHAIGTDFSTGRFTHSIRVGYLHFHNLIADAVAGSNILNPAPGLAITITPSSSDFTCLAGGEAFCSGTNILAPQQTFQTDKQFKYDGTFTVRTHTLRYGIGVDRILGGGFAKFFGIAPNTISIFNPANDAIAASGPFSGGDTNPLNWPVSTVIMGNGQGFFTEIPEFGFPAGGQFDTRFEWYFGDSWKLRSNLTLNYGLRYVRDTGRSDSDLAGVPALAMFNNQFFNGLQNRINQPNHNFAPQLGIAWDPTGSGKTVIRVGSGIYYENAIFNNVLFDRPGRLTQGLFFGTAAPCFLGSASATPLPGGGSLPAPTFCGEAIGSAASQIIALQQQYQAAVAAAGPQSNGAFISNTLAEGVESTGDQLIGPDYRSPYSIQINAGIQHQFGHGTVLSVDYLRNVGLHYLLGVDTNHDGDARFLNVAAAQNAISVTNNSFGCGTGFDQASSQCAIRAGATISSYATNGLDSGTSFLIGFPASAFLLTPSTGAAFPGINPNVGQNQMLFPIGRSVYNGMDVSLKSNLDHPMPGMRHLSLIASYSLSRFNTMAADQDFVNNATDFANPTRFFGPDALDRTHQLGVGAVMDLPWATRWSLSTHWDTALPVTLFLPSTGAPGDIFVTDVTGDGTVGDVLPGTNIGAFGRSVKVGDLTSVVNNYNSTAAGQLTPAGQALVAAGLFTQAQLQALGAVTPTLALPLPGHIGVSPLFEFDTYLSWEIRPSKVWHSFPESFVIEPKISLFNLFNFQNFDPGGNVLSGVLQPACTPLPTCVAPGNVTGQTRASRANLISPGSASGVNWYGVPRQAEFGVKFSF